MMASVLGLGLALGGNQVMAQVFNRPASSSAVPAAAEQAPVTLHFVKEAGERWMALPETGPDKRTGAGKGLESGPSRIVTEVKVTGRPGPERSWASPFFRWPWSRQEVPVPAMPPAAIARLPKTFAPAATVPASAWQMQPSAPVPSIGLVAFEIPNAPPPQAPPAPWQPSPMTTAAPLSSPAAGLQADVPMIQQTGVQQPEPPGQRLQLAEQEGQEYQVQLEPPGIQRWSKLVNEQGLQEEMRQAARQRTPPERIEFPTDYKPLATHAYAGRSWPARPEVVEPNYTCYKRLYFEQRNFERYGWDLGIAQPALSGAIFFWDVATLPYHMGTAVGRNFECSAGYCLPGDPVPLLLYPPELSVTGLAAEAAAVVAVTAIFP